MDNQKFVCACGHKESMKAFEERRKREGAGVSKKDVQNYMKKMKKEENKPVNSGLADALANIKLCLLLAVGVLSLLTMRADVAAATPEADTVVATAQKRNDAGEQIARAFPTDMEHKPLTAYSVQYGTVNVYKDSSLSEQIGQVDGARLWIIAVRAEGDAVFGEYTSGEDTGSGWFSADTFIVDPSYEPVYATARDGMYAYTDGSFDQVQGTIGKYTGIIVVTREGDRRQVIYETEEGYAMGWMTGDAFSNCLLYDGRDKQILADGVYLFRCGYMDDESGGAAMENQTGLAAYDSYTMELTYVSDNDYYIKNQETGQYLSAERTAAGTDSAGKEAGDAAAAENSVAGMSPGRRSPGQK